MKIKVINRCFIFALYFAIIPISLFARENSRELLYGKHINIYSEVLKEERPLYISCPENYDKTQQHYPVLYTLDAERYFQHTVALVQFLATNARTPQMIIIGIPNTNRRRDFSYAPSENDSLRGADYFLQFLANELIPYVDAHYRTRPYRLIKGWCATGIFCINALFTHPELFDAYIATSPYLVNNARFMFQLVEDYPQHKLKSHKFLFISVGGQDRPDSKKAIPQFVTLLNKKALSGLEWHFTTLEKEDHFTIDLRTFYLGLETLYADLIDAGQIVKNGMESARVKVKSLAKQYGFEKSLPDDMLIEMGYHLMNQERFKEAVTLFKINVEAHPDSWNAHDSLAEAYMMEGNKELAIKHYQQSIQLNPENDNARQMLKKLNTNK